MVKFGLCLLVYLSFSFQVFAADFSESIDESVQAHALNSINDIKVRFPNLSAEQYQEIFVIERYRLGRIMSDIVIKDLTLPTDKSPQYGVIVAGGNYSNYGLVFYMDDAVVLAEQHAKANVTNYKNIRLIPTRLLAEILQNTSQQVTKREVVYGVSYGGVVHKLF